MDFVLYFLLGCLISILSGFFGVGGGFILTPVLLLIGFSPISAIITSLFFTVGTSFSGIFAHIRLKNIVWRQGIILGISGIASTLVARPFVFYMDKQGWDVKVIPFLYIFFLAYMAFSMFKSKGTAVSKENKSVQTSIVKIALVGIMGGFVSATLGVGGGFILVPLSISLLGLDVKKAVGTSLFSVLLIGGAGYISYAMTTAINYKAALLLVAGGLIGSHLGAKLTLYFEQKEMKTLLAYLYLITLCSVVFKLAGLNLAGLCVLGMFILFFLVRSYSRWHSGVKGTV